MDMLTVVYAALVLFVAYLVRGIAGFGSGLIAVPMLSLIAPVPLVVPLVVSLDYIGSLSQWVKNRDHVAWKEQPPGSSAASPPRRVHQPPPGKRRPAPPGAGAHPPTRPA
jgi:sulfite exporter TauE/SafE